MRLFQPNRKIDDQKRPVLSLHRLCVALASPCIQSTTFNAARPPRPIVATRTVSLGSHNRTAWAAQNLARPRQTGVLRLAGGAFVGLARALRGNPARRFTIAHRIAEHCRRILGACRFPSGSTPPLDSNTARVPCTATTDDHPAARSTKRSRIRRTDRACHPPLGTQPGQAEIGFPGTSCEKPATLWIRWQNRPSADHFAART